MKNEKWTLEYEQQLKEVKAKADRIPETQKAMDSQSSVLTQDLPNTADWERLLAPAVSTGNNKFKINKEEQRAASQQDSQASILTDDLPQTCDWILPIATHHKNNTSNNQGKTTTEQCIHDEEDITSSTSSIIMKDITQTKRQDEATSSSSTVLLSVTNKRLPCNAHSKASKTNNENNNMDHDNSTISTLSPYNPVPTKQQKLQQRQQPQILKVRNETFKNAPPTPRLHQHHHNSLPTEIPIIKQNGPFASPLSTGTISTVDDSPSPKQPSTMKSNWFQKKKRRKLKQTTLNFALK